MDGQIGTKNHARNYRKQKLKSNPPKPEVSGSPTVQRRSTPVRGASADGRKTSRRACLTSRVRGVVRATARIRVGVWVDMPPRTGRQPANRSWSGRRKPEPEVEPKLSRKRGSIGLPGYRGAREALARRRRSGGVGERWSRPSNRRAYQRVGEPHTCAGRDDRSALVPITTALRLNLASDGDDGVGPCRAMRIGLQALRSGEPNQPRTGTVVSNSAGQSDSRMARRRVCRRGRWSSKAGRRSLRVGLGEDRSGGRVWYLRGVDEGVMGGRCSCQWSSSRR